jgi:hypothetical protein
VFRPKGLSNLNIIDIDTDRKYRASCRKESDQMKICRNKATREVYICLEKGEDIQDHFVLPDGRVEMFDRTDFEAFERILDYYSRAISDVPKLQGGANQ